MTSNRSEGDEAVIRMQERISELEKSNQALHAEILKRKQESHRIDRYNSILEGINRIFGSIVKAETKEDLGVACLCVALEVTGSQIGFVGEVGADGLMHDVAISESGWDECLMYDKTGHRRRPGDYILHGLYGRVIDSGKSFFTNNPPSDPDSIGFPDGHPPLRSFLGVPLILDGKTIGILGVANREGSYTSEQQEDLEAIAPAVVQVLQRKREEKEREKAEEALRKNRAKLEAALASMTDAVFIFDAQGRFIDFNDAFATFHRFRNKEECSRTFAEYPDILDVFMAGGMPAPLDMWAVPRALRGETVTDAEYILRRKDTGETWVGSYSFAPIRDKEGAIVGAVVIGRDITERKQAEKALHDAYEKLRVQSEELQAQTEELQEAYEALSESEESYRNIIETASEGIWIGDSEARTTYVNKRMTEMLGYTQDEMIGRFAWDFADEEGKPIIKENIEKRRHGIDESYEFKFIRKDGSHLWAIVSSKSLSDDNGRFTGSMSMLTDITKRKEAEAKLKETLDSLEEKVKERTAELEKAYNSLKESEEKYRSFIENFKGIAFQADENFIPVFLHGTVEEITGYSEEEFVSRQPWKEIIHPEDLSHIYEEEEKVRNSQYKTSGEIDFRIIRKDGKIKWVHEIYQKIPGNNRTPDKYQGAIYDITERKEAEEALSKIEKIRIKEIHHRIKNNLQVISSLLDLQAEAFSHLETCKTPEVVEAFMESQNRVISMALIHEELYKGDKIDTLDFAAYLRKLAEDILSSYNPGNMDISLKLDLEQVSLGMDTAIPLGIIVNELVSNSFKYAFPAGRKGEIWINLRKFEASDAGNSIPGQDGDCMEKNRFHHVLEVLDNGKGIPEEIDLKNMDSLGLQLVNVLVEQIDACIGLERNQGTKFIILFNDIEV